jgi:acyl-coenzyme A thioesterase PaaI-like protein
LDQTAESAARQRIGAAIRRLGHRIVGTTVDTDALSVMATDLESMVASLNGAPRSRPTEGFRETFRAPPDGATIGDKPDRPYSGAASPLGCDLAIRRSGQEIVATATLDSAHEGPPGRAHGGVTAAIFDDLFGYVLHLEQTAAFTGDLHVRYERGVPMHRELTFRVRLVERVGRKLLMAGECSDGEYQVASAKATFIAPADTAVPSPPG